MSGYKYTVKDIAEMNAEIDRQNIDIDRLRAENAQLRDDLDLRNQTAVDRKEIIGWLEAENERLRAALITAAVWMPKIPITSDAKKEVEQVRAALEQTAAEERCQYCGGKGWYLPVVTPPACEYCNGTGNQKPVSDRT